MTRRPQGRRLFFRELAPRSRRRIRPRCRSGLGARPGVDLIVPAAARSLCIRAGMWMSVQPAKSTPHSAVMSAIGVARSPPRTRCRPAGSSSFLKKRSRRSLAARHSGRRYCGIPALASRAGRARRSRDVCCETAPRPASMPSSLARFSHISTICLVLGVGAHQRRLGVASPRNNGLSPSPRRSYVPSSSSSIGTIACGYLAMYSGSSLRTASETSSSGYLRCPFRRGRCAGGAGSARRASRRSSSSSPLRHAGRSSRGGGRVRHASQGPPLVGGVRRAGAGRAAASSLGKARWEKAARVRPSALYEDPMRR